MLPSLLLKSAATSLLRSQRRCHLPMQLEARMPACRTLRSLAGLLPGSRLHSRCAAAAHGSQECDYCTIRCAAQHWGP